MFPFNIALAVVRQSVTRGANVCGAEGRAYEFFPANGDRNAESLRGRKFGEHRGFYRARKGALMSG